MKTSLKILTLGFILLLLSLPTLSSAQPPDSYSENNEMRDHPMMRPGMDDSMGSMSPHEYGGGMKHWMKPHNAAVHFLQMKDALGLNEKQIGDLKALRDAYRAENTVNEAKLKSAEQELREILEEDTINLEKAEAKLKEIGALEGPIWSSFVRQLAKIKTIVPKEQMKKMHEMRGGRPMMERE